MKKILLKIFNRQNKIIKFLSIIKNIFFNFIQIGKISKRYAINLLPKLISSQIQVEKNREKIFKHKNYFERRYNFNHDDWFSHNIPIWEKYINNFLEIDYLEIGCFEGRSTVYIGEIAKVKSITTIDTFKGGDEHSNINFDLVYNNFKKNIEKLDKKNIDVIDDLSDNFFKTNTKSFNLIYVDGSHHYKDVKNDFLNSFNVLKKDGIIIFDDFLWEYYENSKNNPMCAIIEVYKILKDNFKILHVNNQVIFQKKNA
tara:strand:+ start:2591 stop:3358 length:768 start_codon:yes stop_codon:yes gene_type:complete